MSIYQRDFFADLSGRPLDDGAIYIGESSQDPETNPVACFWDAALSVPASQPITVSAGYIVNAGARADVYTAEPAYSLRIRDKNGVQVDYIPVTSGASPPFGVSVLTFGATGNGVTDDTAAIQAAIDSGATSVYIPAGTYLVSSLLMPNVFNFVLYGVGPASKLKQKAGASGALIRWATASVVYNEQTVRDIGITGTNGAQHCIDTSGAGGLTIEGIYITDVPVGKSGIYSNGAAATYNHDNRISNIQIYSNTAGHSGIRLGPLSADTKITDFIMNANFVTSYCLYLDSGAQSTKIADSHPYNAAVNVIYLAGGNTGTEFNGVTADNATNDIVRIVASSVISFSGCRIQAVKSGYSGVNITGVCVGITLINTLFDGAAGALSCVVAGASADAVLAFGGSIPSVGNFTTPFNFSGQECLARGFAGFAPLGLFFQKEGCGSAAQAQATTRYYGCNGGVATEANADLMIAQDSRLVSLAVVVDTTPAAGQTMTFRARKNGVDIGTAIVVNNGGFGGVLTLAESFSQFDRLTISSVFSATSGSATVRWTAEFLA